MGSSRSSDSCHMQSYIHPIAKSSHHYAADPQAFSPITLMSLLLLLLQDVSHIRTWSPFGRNLTAATAEVMSASEHDCDHRNKIGCPIPKAPCM